MIKDSIYRTVYQRELEPVETNISAVKNGFVRCNMKETHHVLSSCAVFSRYRELEFTKGVISYSYCNKSGWYHDIIVPSILAMGLFFRVSKEESESLLSFDECTRATRNTKYFLWLERRHKVSKIEIKKKEHIL